MTDDPCRPVKDFYNAKEALDGLAVVDAVYIRPDGERRTLEIRVSDTILPPAVMDVLVTHAMAVNPDRTNSRPGETVVIAY